MIRVDAGNDLHELLNRAAQLGRSARLDVAVPFYDTDSRLWRLLLAARDSGVRLRLLVRPGDAMREEMLDALMGTDTRVVRLPKLHAKTILLTHKGGHHSMGWIGSHNFTKASECTAQELGVAFCGHGQLECRLLQQALIQLDAWEREATWRRKSA